MFSTIFGLSSGVFITVWANMLAKQRLLYRPWNHLLVGGIGAYVGYNMTSWEDSMLQNINEQRARRNMVPISRESLGHFKYPSSSTQQEN